MPPDGGKRKADKSEDQDDDEEWVTDPSYEVPSWITSFGKGGAIEDDEKPQNTCQTKKKTKVEPASGSGNKQKKKKPKQKVYQNEGQKHNKKKAWRGEDGYQRGQKWGMRGHHKGGFGGGGKQWGGFRNENNWGGFRNENHWGGFGGFNNQWGMFGDWENQWDGFGGGGYNGVWGGPQPQGCGEFEHGDGRYNEFGGNTVDKRMFGRPGPLCPPHGQQQAFNYNPVGNFPYDQENCYDDGEDDEDELNTCPPFIWNPTTGELMPLNKDLDIDITKMSTLDRMKLFVNYLRNTKCHSGKYDSPVMVVVNGLCLSKVGFEARYEVELLMRFSGRALFTGVLHVDEFFMARSVAVSKKQAKTDCYIRALENLYKKPLQFLMNMTDVGAEAIRDELGKIYPDLTLDTFPLEAQRVLDVLTQQATVGKKKFARKLGLLNLESGLAKLITFLKYSNQVTPNAVCRITQAFTSSKCNLSHDYEEDRVRLETGQMWFKGRIYIGDIIIAGAGDYRKKVAKEKTYQRAVEALLTKPLETVLKGVSLLDLDDAPPEGEMAGEPGLVVDVEKMAKRLEKLTALLQQSADSADVVSRFDAACSTVQLTPTRLFRRGAEERGVCLHCELYLDNILVASGTGNKKNTAQQSAYSKAVDVVMSKKAEQIVADAKKLTKEVMAEPDVMEISVKGQSRWGESNLTKLNRLGIEPSQTPYGISDFVIMEHYDWAKDRTKFAFLVLSQSATQNGMLLEWNMSPNGNLFRCLMRLQGQDIGEASASAKTNARNLAAVDALFKLYETRPVIRSLQRNETEYWNTYESIKSKALALKQASGCHDNDPDEWVDCTEPVPDTPVDFKETTPVEVRDSQCAPVSKWVIQVLQTMLSQYAETDTLDDLLFGPGLPFGERKKITQMCQGLGLKYLARQLKDESYSAVFKKWTPQDMVAHLQARGGVSGKYVLVDRGELPTHSQARTFISDQELTARQKADTWKHMQACQVPPAAGLNPGQGNLPLGRSSMMNSQNNAKMKPVLNNPAANAGLISYPTVNYPRVNNSGMKGGTAYNPMSNGSVTDSSATCNPARIIPMPNNPPRNNSMSSNYTSTNPVNNPTPNNPLMNHPTSNSPMMNYASSNNASMNNMTINNPVMNYNTPNNPMMNNPTANNSMTNYPTATNTMMNTSSNTMMNYNTSSNPVINNPTTNNNMMNYPTYNNSVMNYTTSNNSMMKNPSTNNVMMNHIASNNSRIDNALMNVPATNSPMVNNPMTNNPMTNISTDAASFQTSTPKMGRIQQQPFFSGQRDAVPEYVTGGVWKGEVDTSSTASCQEAPIPASAQQYGYGYVGGDELTKGGTNSQFGTPMGAYSQTPMGASNQMPVNSYNQTPDSYHTANTSFQSFPGVYSSEASAYATPDGSNTHGMSSMYMSF